VAKPEFGKSAYWPQTGRVLRPMIAAARNFAASTPAIVSCNGRVPCYRIADFVLDCEDENFTPSDSLTKHFTSLPKSVSRLFSRIIRMYVPARNRAGGAT
jgi:hypothetical protein